MRYWTSDLHYYHHNIIQYDNRPFADVFHMHDELIKRHNMVVKPEDETWFIGDISFNKVTKTKPIIKQLNGYKVLVRGNHDPNINRCYQMGFDLVVHGDSIGTKIGDYNVMVSHYPYANNNEEFAKFKKRRIKDEGLYLIHGHVHTQWKMKQRMINVGACQWNYAPISDQDILNLIESREAELMRRIKEGEDTAYL